MPGKELRRCRVSFFLWPGLLDGEPDISNECLALGPFLVKIVILWQRMLNSDSWTNLLLLQTRNEEISLSRQNKGLFSSFAVGTFRCFTHARTQSFSLVPITSAVLIQLVFSTWMCLPLEIRDDARNQKLGFNQEAAVCENDEARVGSRE